MAVKCSKCQGENPETARFCLDCGTRLGIPETPQISITKTLETPQEALSRGTLYAGRYEIIEALGVGGMGEVYRVEDKKVVQEVALKLIKPEIAENKRTIERFRQELKTARMISHRNVCRMFDLGEEKGTYFITMEYVAGEDLKSFLRRSKQLALGTAISITKQICEGLAEAHRLGVVHRDLKPGNIMIDKEGNARIMDFGIARSLAAKRMTGAGVMVGTPEYISPEQIEGKEADGRSDIYSMGVILFEMLTGRLPFEGDTALSIAVKHKTEPPPDPQKLAPQIPDELGRLILRCLEKDREKRFQKAEEVISELVRIEQEVPASERPRPVVKRRPLTSREVTVTFGLKKIAIFALGIVLLAAVAIFLWKQWARGKMPLPAAGKPNLAVLYFENISQDRSLDDWKTGIPQLLMTDLGQSKLISVLSYDEVYGILQTLDLTEAQKYSSSDLTRIARQSQASHMITGSILKPGDKIIITLTMKESSGKDCRSWSEGFECSGEAEIPGIVDRMTAKIKQALGLTRSQMSGDFDAPAVDITTSSMEAFKLYNEGRRLHLAEEYEKSIPLMLMAVEKDPEFALAYRSLSAALVGLGRSEEADRYLQKAWKLSGKASLKERFWIEIDYYRQSEKTYDKALETCQKWLDLYPDDTHPMMLTGLVHIHVEDVDQAIKFLDMSIQKGNVSPFSFYYLAAAYNQSGAFEKGRQAAERGLRVHSDSILIEGALFDNYISQGKIDEAQAWLDRWEAKRPALAVGLRMGDLKILQGKYEAAAAKFAKYDPSKSYIKSRLPFLKLSEGKIKQAVELARAANDHLSLIYLNYRLGNFEGALAESRMALQNALEKGSLSDQAWALQMRGLVELAMGSMDVARRTAAELEKSVAGAVNRKLVRHHYFLTGMIEREAGRYASAVDFMKKAIALLPGESWVLGNPWKPIFFDGLAASYFKSGDLGRAKEEYRRIQSLALGRLRYGDIYAGSFYWLGKIAEKQEKKAEAVENFRKFLDLWKDADPGLPEVEDAHARLEALRNSG